jgi:hypothetical protein
MVWRVDPDGPAINIEYANEQDTRVQVGDDARQYLVPGLFSTAKLHDDLGGGREVPFGQWPLWQSIVTLVAGVGGSNRPQLPPFEDARASVKDPSKIMFTDE